MGFAGPEDPALAYEFLNVSPYKMLIGGGDILEVARINCETGQNADPSSPTNFCSLNERQQRQLIERATGMAADDFLDRRLTRYYFFQRPQHQEWPGGGASTDELCSHDPRLRRNCLKAVIEHSAIAVTLRSDNSVASVTGRVFSKYRITNKPELPAGRALAVAYEQLWEVPGISRYEDQPITEEELPLVLLPYANAKRSDLSRVLSLRWPRYRTPQLRYAYRTTLWGDFVDEDGRRVEAASWRAWVDAETGRILQLIPQFEFANGVDAKGRGWRLHPSPPLGADDLPQERLFEVDGLGSVPKVCQCPDGVDPVGKYCLKLEGAFEQVELAEIEYDNQQQVTPTFLCSPATDFASGLNCATSPWDCLCLQDDLAPVHYLLMNAYAHSYAYKQKLDNAICSSSTVTPPNVSSFCVDGLFQAAVNKGSDAHVPLRIKVGGDSLGMYEAAPGSPHLVFGETNRAFLNNCDQLDARLRPGAQDATLMTHEFAHVVMDGLLASRANEWCGEEVNCSVPVSSDLLHDMADGLSAVSNRTNWFGKWWGNYYPGANHSERGMAIRKFEVEVDHFPEHRSWNGQIGYYSKGYADGQIAAAALWAVTDKMHSWGGELGRATFETSLLNALPNRYFVNTCQAVKEGNACDYPDDCDIDVYRYLHILLKDLVANDSATGVGVTSNKLIAGFAKVGIFLVPPQCIGAGAGDAYCPSGTYGGDAVIDVKNDRLHHGSATNPAELPAFDVWTGPMFQFSGHDAVVQASVSRPCNKSYRISIANNPWFENVEGAHKLSKDTAWLDTQGECQVQWSPEGDGEWQGFWAEIAAASREHQMSSAYYRVVTRNSGVGNAPPTSSSSEYPGSPNWDASDQRVGPPFAVLYGTDDQ
jgi:hypothetical protein